MPHDHSIKPSPLSSETSNLDSLSTFGWKVANMMTLLVTTSISVTLIQSPLNSLMLNKFKFGTVLPSSDTNPGAFAIVRMLYAGLGSGLTSAGARTAYVTSAKKNTPDGEEGVDKKTSNASISSTVKTISYISAIALGDVLVTQFSETKSQLLKLHVIAPQFQWKSKHNLLKLSTTGLFPRFCGAQVNFVSLCMIEGWYADMMNFKNTTVNHLLAGAASGMTAAIASLPFSYYRDYVLSQSKIIHGDLVIPSTEALATQAKMYVTQHGWSKTVKLIIDEFSVQAPLRMGRVGATFAILSGVSSALGDEPLLGLKEMVRDRPKAQQTPFGFFSRTIKETSTQASQQTPKSCTGPN